MQFTSLCTIVFYIVAWCNWLYNNLCTSSYKFEKSLFLDPKVYNWFHLDLVGQISCNGAGGIPPATLVEFTLNGYDNTDFYDVSLVDGYNLPVSVLPVSSKRCNSTGCPADVNKSCPPELQDKDSHVGDVKACKSACLAFNKPEFCCTGAYSRPQTCPPTKYSKFFKGLCPQAYSYAYDDTTSTFTCPSGSTDYIITFCP